MSDQLNALAVASEIKRYNGDDPELEINIMRSGNRAYGNHQARCATHRYRRGDCDCGYTDFTNWVQQRWIEDGRERAQRDLLVQGGRLISDQMADNIVALRAAPKTPPSAPPERWTELVFEVRTSMSWRLRRRFLALCRSLRHR